MEHQRDLLREAIKYRKAYEILIEYFDSIADEEKEYVHTKLSELGL